jgi:hypothetical protein
MALLPSALQRAYPGRIHPVPEFAQTTKSAAKRLAQEITAEIPDRHQRARVRTQCYNQIMALLDQIEQMVARQRAQTRHLWVLCGCAGAVLGSVSTWLLLNG